MSPLRSRTLAGVLTLVAACVGGAVGCDSSKDATKESEAKPSDITWEALASAREQLLAGAGSVPLSADGSVRYNRTLDIAAATGTEELAVNGRVVLRWTHAGFESHLQQDTDGDGTFDWQLDTVGGPKVTDRRTVVTSGRVGAGEPTRRQTTTQTSDLLVQVTIEEAGAGGWSVVEMFQTTALQSAGPADVTTSGCTAEQETQLRAGSKDAVNQGLECLKRLGVNDVHDKLVTMLASRPVHFECGAGVAGTCGGASIIDTWVGSTYVQGSLVSDYFAVLGSKISISTGSALGGPGCPIPKLIFHELFHIATGESHSSRLDVDTREGRSKDRVWSCSDICFDKMAATQCECAQCLRTTREDPRCAAFAPCAPDDCPPNPPSCGAWKRSRDRVGNCCAAGQSCINDFCTSPCKSGELMCPAFAQPGFGCCPTSTKGIICCKPESTVCSVPVNCK